MANSEWETIWPALVDLAPEKLVFTGGEPLLRPDLPDLLSSVRRLDVDHRIKRCLNTSGTPVTLAIAQRLRGLVDEVRVSLDALEDRNDRLRGAGSFACAERAIRHFKFAGHDPKVLITVSEVSLPDLEDLLCLLADWGITAVNINLFQPIGRGKAHEEWSVNIGAVKRAIEKASLRIHTGWSVPSVTQEASGTHCGVGHYLNLMPNGDVFPCHVLVDPRFRCGNVRDQDLREICNWYGTLGKLAQLNFTKLATSDPEIASSLRRDRCLGVVHQDTRSNGVWDQIFPKPLR